MAWLSAPEGEGLIERAVSRVREVDVSPETDGCINDSRVPATCKESSAPEAGYYPDLDVLLVQLAALREDIDRLLMPPSTRMSIMLTRYPGAGARYARHRDSMPEHGEVGQRRRITAVYYLNSDWEPSHGGCFRAYFPEGLGREVEGAKPCGGESALDREWSLDVEPRLDRLVLFASEFLEHEVLPAQMDRHACTMWLY